MTKLNHALKILTIVVPVVLTAYLIGLFSGVSSLFSDYFLISTVLLPLVLSFSIFLTAWLAYSKNMDGHSLFLGVTFYILGILDMYYMLSYPFMPDFITINSPQKSAIIWIEARLISAILFLVSVHVYKDTYPRLINKNVLLIFAGILSLTSCSVVLYYSEEMPAMLEPDGTPSSEMIFLMFITAAIILYTTYLYTKRLQETGEKSIICLIYGLVVIILSIPFYIFQDYSENLLRAAGFYFIYLAVYKISIEQPYEELAQAKEKLRHLAEERYRNLFDYANDAIIIHDLGERVVAWNKSAEKTLGWEAEEVIGKKISQLMVPPKLQAERNQIVRNALLGKAVTGIDTVRLRKDGSKVDVSVTISPLMNAKQKVIGFSSIIRDITERKRAEENIKKSLDEKEVLLREIHHRVKNNMQVISSMLRLQSGYIKEENYIRIFKESQNRIITMSLIHEKLYQSGDLARIDFNEYTRDLVNSLVLSYGINMNKIALNIKVKNIYLGIDDAIPCGLIINELVTNSLKHAFPDDRDGEITVDIRSNNGPEIEILIKDNGVGVPENIDFKKTQSMGLHLVTMLAENQLQGEINLNRNEGTEYQIKFKRGK